MRRGWITFDGQQIWNFSTIKRFRESFVRTGDWYSVDEQVNSHLDEDGFFTRNDFVNGLKEYIGLQVDDAILSTNPIIRALAMAKGGTHANQL
jgi:hypothetical protein